MLKIISVRECHISLGLALASVLCTAACPALATTYNFEVFVQDGDNIGGVDIFSPRDPSLNNNGDLAFGAFFADPTTGFSTSGIFVNDQLRVQSGDNIGGVNIDFPNSPSLNNNGDLAFETPFLDPTTGNSTRGIFVNDQLRVQSSDNIGGVDIFSPNSPSLNDNGDVAFAAFFTDPTTGFSTSGIFVNDQLRVQRGDNVGGFEINFPRRPSLNNNGDLAFQTDVIDPMTGFFISAIFFNDQLQVQDGDNVGGFEITSPNSPSLNDNGDLAFGAFFRDPTTGNFTSGIYVNDQLRIRNSDNIGGLDIISVDLGNPSLNDDGDVAFEAVFRNPTTGVFKRGIFIARPVLVPEPITATLGLMGIATLGMATRRRVA